jgi:hypothetical protein
VTKLSDKSLKYFLIIFLISVLTFPFWGSYSYFALERKKIRTEVDRALSAGMDKTKLVNLRFSVEDSKTLLTWKHSREFVYQGQMYDIVEQRQEGDFILFTCYNDNKETRLEKNKEKIIAEAIGQDPTRKSQSENLTNFLNTVFSQDSNSFLSYSPQVSTIHFSLFTLHYSLFTQAPLSPPPKCC